MWQWGTMEGVTEGAVFQTEHRAWSAMRNHRHGSPFVTIVLTGAYVEVRDAIPELCREGSVVVHDIAEEHADRFASDTRCLNVDLEPKACISSIRGNVVLDSPALRDAVGRVVRSFYCDKPKVPDAAKSLQAALLERCFRSSADWPAWLRRVIDAFPWAEPLPLREAAAMAGVHETHFSRAFRRYVGMTAIQYRARARVQLASRLLLTTTASLSRIALSAAYSDQSHLTRAFGERIGLSPGGYRQAFVR